MCGGDGGNCSFLSIFTTQQPIGFFQDAPSRFFHDFLLIYFPYLVLSSLQIALPASSLRFSPSSLFSTLSSPVRMKLSSGKRKSEDVEITERRVTRSLSSGKSSSSTNPNNTISSSPPPSTEIVDHKPPQRPIGKDGNYYECEMCYKVGRLLCCEICPRAYHLKCLGLETVPEGHWNCPSCCDDFSRPIKYLLRDSTCTESEPAAPKLKYSPAYSRSKRD